MDTPTQDIPDVEPIYSIEDIIKQVEASGINLGDNPSARINTFIDYGLLPQPKNGNFSSWAVQRIIAIQNKLYEGKSLQDLKDEVSKERRRFLNQVTDLNSMVHLYKKFSSNSMFFLASLLLLAVVSFGFLAAGLTGTTNPVVVASENIVKAATNAGRTVAKTAAKPLGQTLVTIIKTSKDANSTSVDPLQLTNLEIDTPVIPENLVQLDSLGNLNIGGDIVAATFAGSGKGLTDLDWDFLVNRPSVLAAVDSVSNDGGNIDLIAGNGVTITPNDDANTITFSTASTTDIGSAQEIFKNISVSGQSNVVADLNTDTLTFAQGSNVVITTNEATDTITIGVTGTVSNADTLDLIDSAQFLRSDTGDSFTSGTLAFNAGTIVDINGSLDLPTAGITGGGAGSGLNADLLDSVSSASFSQKASNETISGAWTFGSTSSTPLLVKPSGAFGATHFDVQNSSGTSLFNVDTLGNGRFAAHLYTGGLIRVGNDGTLYNINAIAASGTVDFSGVLNVTNAVNIGNGVGGVHYLTINKSNTANIINTTRSSNRIILQGAYWTGASTDINMQILNIVTSTAPAYRVSFLDNGSVERAYIDNSGNASFSGNLSVSGGNITSNASQLILTAAGANADVVVQGGLCIRSATACPDVAAGGLQVDTAGGSADDPGDVFDFAEIYDSTQPLEQGDVVTAGGERKIKRSDSTYDQGVIGIVSTHPAAMINEGSFSVGVDPASFNPNKPWVALAGRVPTKVSTENGNIEPGDPLTSSSTPGVAMKATESGPIIGKALESFDGAQVGKVMVFVSTGWYVAPIESGQDVRSQMSDLSSLTSIDTQRLTAGVINTQVLFVGERKLSMAKNGSLKIDGDVEVIGDLIANKLIGKEVQTEKISISDQISNPSIGSSELKSGDGAVFVKTNAVTTNSKVFITPTSSTGGQSLQVSNKKQGEGFTVRIDNAVNMNIKFDWLVIN